MRRWVLGGLVGAIAFVAGLLVVLDDGDGRDESVIAATTDEASTSSTSTSTSTSTSSTTTSSTTTSSSSTTTSSTTTSTSTTTTAPATTTTVPGPTTTTVGPHGERHLMGGGNSGYEELAVAYGAPGERCVRYERLTPDPVVYVDECGFVAPTDGPLGELRFFPGVEPDTLHVFGVVAPDAGGWYCELADGAWCGGGATPTDTLSPGVAYLFGTGPVSWRDHPRPVMVTFVFSGPPGSEPQRVEVTLPPP